MAAQMAWAITLEILKMDVATLITAARLFSLMLGLLFLMFHPSPWPGIFVMMPGVVVGDLLPERYRADNHRPFQIALGVSLLAVAIRGFIELFAGQLALQRGVEWIVTVFLFVSAALAGVGFLLMPYLAKRRARTSAVSSEKHHE
jgi:hypothetical protein